MIGKFLNFYHLIEISINDGQNRPIDEFHVIINFIISDESLEML
jgi:hypothetical protein